MIKAARNIGDFTAAAINRFIPINKTASAASDNPLQSEQDKAVDACARGYVQKIDTVGLSIGVFNAGLISFYNYGEIIKRSHQLPAADTLFEIGSITKTFTATILALLVNDGKANLNDSIGSYLPELVAANPPLRDITLLHLINHSSGLPRLPGNLSSQRSFRRLNPYKNYTQQLLFDYLKSCSLASKPDEKYGYSNLATGLLGYILEIITGQSFAQMVTGMICKPLEMHNAIQRLLPQDKAQFASPYCFNLKTTPWDFDVLAGCGALKSTVNDLLLYAGAHLSDRAGSIYEALKLTREVTFDKGVKLGLAWHNLAVNGIDYCFHNGGTYGSRSFLAFNKERNLAVVVLSNAGISVDQASVDLLKQLK